jgi:hypothetical protein
VNNALSSSDDDPDRLNRMREELSSALRVLAAATESEGMLFLKTLHPNVRRVLVAYGTKKLAFMREVSDICGCADDEAIIMKTLMLVKRFVVWWGRSVG